MNASRIFARRLHCSSHWKRPESPYDILGVKKTATHNELKQAYYRLSKELHPDCNVGASEGERRRKKTHYFVIQEAYGLLSNDATRKSFDNSSGPSFNRNMKNNANQYQYGTEAPLKNVEMFYPLFYTIGVVFIVSSWWSRGLDDQIKAQEELAWINFHKRQSRLDIPVGKYPYAMSSKGL